MTKEKKTKRNPYILFVGIGIELVGIEIGMIFVGHQIDQKFGLPGVGIAALSLAGLSVWLYHIVRLLKNIEAESEAES